MSSPTSILVNALSTALYNTRTQNYQNSNLFQTLGFHRCVCCASLANATKDIYRYIYLISLPLQISPSPGFLRPQELRYFKNTPKIFLELQEILAVGDDRTWLAFTKVSISVWLTFRDLTMAFLGLVLLLSSLLRID